MLKKLLFVLALLPSFVFAQTNLSQGGTGWTSSTVGQLLVGTSSTLRYSRLDVGSAGTVLQASSTSPFRMAWVTLASIFDSLLSSNNTWTGTNNFTATTTLDKVVAGTSAGLQFFSNGLTQVADFGAGGGSNASFLGGVNITGNLAVDTNTLYVDSTNNRVGIGTTTPGYNAVISGSDAALSIDNNSGSASFIRMNNHGTQRFVLDARSAATSFNSLTAPLAFITSSVERVRIDNSGNVGIGTTTPQAPLEVYSPSGNVGNMARFSSGYSSGGFVSLFDVANNTTRGFFGYGPTLFTIAGIGDAGFRSQGGLAIGTNGGTVRQYINSSGAFGLGGSITNVSTFAGASLVGNSSGNIGIGTTTPTSQLSIVGSAGTGAPLQGGVNGATLSLLSTTNGVGDGGAVVFGTATGPNGFAGIKGFLQTGTANTAGDLAFYTRRFTSDANLTESMRILYNGNIGIGTTSPGTSLTVGAGLVAQIPNGAGSNFTPQISNSQTSGVAGISAGVSDGTNYRRAGLFVNQTNGVWGLSSLYTSGAIPFVINEAGTERLRIDTSGNVGIGTTTPVAPLTVYSTSTSGTSPVFMVATTTPIIRAQANGRVGIGSNVGTPSAPLHIFTPVANSTTVTGQYIVNAGSGAGAGAELLLGYAATAAGSGGIASFYDTSHFGGTIGVKTRLSAGGTTFLTGSVTGDVGIGTTTPSARLAIQGQSGSTTPLFSIASSSGAVIPFVTVTPTGRFGISTTSPTSVFSVASTLSDTTQLFNILSSTVSAIIRVLANGSVLIGTPTQANCGVIECGLTVGTTTQFTAGIVARVVGYSSAASTTINLDTTDAATTTVDRATTFVNPSGTMYDVSSFEIIALATTSQTIYWGNMFASSSPLTLPSTIASGTSIYLFQYNKFTNKLLYTGFMGPFN